MTAKEKILRCLQEKGRASGRELAEAMGVSRQAVNRHVLGLLRSGELVKEGRTRGASYSLVKRQGEQKPFTGRPQGQRTFKRRYPLQGLEEDRVFEDVSLLSGLRRHLNRNAYQITNYGFTEILNNAIEHSGSQYCTLSCVLDSTTFTFALRDFGVGIFYSIHRKLGLNNEMESVGELIKGKTTTMPERHTGEGVFFTSKAADKVTFRSHAIQVVFDNVRKDVFVRQSKTIKGTEVVFSISAGSKRRLQAIFEQFAPEEFDYKFEKTSVRVKLFEKEYTSRSEARRLFAGLEKFREITLDFKGVRSIGQGFADEVFRIFTRNHPGITVKTENVMPLLEAVISHVRVDNRN